ncbi:MAG: ABC transporter substrate-binding protein [Bilophila wadsworthia]
MNRFCRLFLFMLMCGGLLFAAVPASAGDGTQAVQEKTPAHPEKKWRVAYIEGGGYTDYQRILAATAKGLAELGVIADGDVPIPEKTDDTRPIWDWLAEHAGGDRLFLKDGYYSANWDAAQRAANRKALLDRIREKGDVDDFRLRHMGRAGHGHSRYFRSVFSMSVTDAVQAGIAKSLKDSGRDNLHAQIDPERYKRQIAVFHDIFGFKKMGIPYEDTPEGRSDVSLAAIESAADELGIELVRCTTALNVPPDQSFANLKQCVSQLAKTSDAVYLTTNSGMQWNRMRELLQPLIEAGVPSFSQSGIEETKLGVLMSLSQSSFSSGGRFGAEAIVKVMDGIRPRDVGHIRQRNRACH